MALRRSNPATWVGLLGGAAWSVPGIASAASLSQDAPSSASGDLIPFALGCVTGAACVGAITLAVLRHKEVKAARDQADSVLSPETFSEQFSARAPEPRRVSEPRRAPEPHCAPEPHRAPEPRDKAKAPARRHAPAASVSAGMGRHMRANPEAMTNWENTGSIRVRQVEGELRGSHLKGGAEPPREQHVVPVVAPLDASARNDLEQVASDYAKDLSFAERVAARARGVAATLGSRISGDMMEGLPMIERADGSVADVGTGWWTKGRGRGGPFDRIALPAARRSSPTTPRSSLPRAMAHRPTSAWRTTPPRGKIDVTAARAAAIATRLSGIDQSAFPEERVAGRPKHEDLWAQALAAMEEQSLPPVEEVEEVIGDMDTLDEIDGLEANTSFIPFRTPAGHPEVVDRETYVDYLIGDEFGRNPSKAVRRTSREYLHVIEGGSQKMMHLRDDSEGARAPRPTGPRHFRTEARTAREA
ncbi:MAG: hypothetical protein LKE37_05380 [Atopobiaceae bacterium]|jgi:hypothetical protein|nr:hypothetical protein [Atopobiaceae bacterium]